MRNVYILVNALEKIEEGLTGQLTVESLARECYCSVSNLQKLFAYVFRFSVGSYITRRRISAAAKRLICTADTITDIAYDFSYSSPEAFTRAFQRLWGETPSAFRKNRKFSNIFPPMLINSQTDNLKGENEMTNPLLKNRRPVDITELYDLLKTMDGTYILSVDARGLMVINDYGYAGGDIAIAEMARRIDEAITDDMFMFRIGGDEFAVVTGRSNLDDAIAVAKAITAKNGAPVVSEKFNFPFSMVVGITTIGPKIRYSDMLSRMYGALDGAKKNLRDDNSPIAVYDA